MLPAINEDTGRSNLLTLCPSRSTTMANVPVLEMGTIDMPPGLFNPVDGIVDTVVPSKLTFLSVLYGWPSVISAYIG